LKTGKTKTKISVSALLALISFMWINNSSLLIAKSDKEPLLLAHRGLAQTFSVQDLKWNTNTAKMIHMPEHPYLENTISSMQKAFDCGADIVEFDVRVTKDRKLAVFHDYTLEFRTNGFGNVADHTMAELKKLDIGYGYTADGGKTFPFRGKHIGMMPVIDEVFGAFPKKEFLIHIKDGGRGAGELLDAHLRKMDPDQLRRISLYGDENAIRYISAKHPEIKVLTVPILKKALLWYELIGWTGYVPKAARNIQIHLPLNYAKYLWGWPDRFIQRMDAVNSRFVAVNGSGEFSSGFDSKEDLSKLPDDYSGCIWTNRIDMISLYIKHKK
jgi:glycerophosphoryl diester phosphodiesterase